VRLTLAVGLTACGGARPVSTPRSPRAQVMDAMKSGDLATAERGARSLARGGSLADEVLLDEVLLRRGKHPEAAARLRPLVSAHPDQAALVGLYARALDALGRQAQAVAAYARRLRLVPTDAKAALRMGTLLLAQGDALHASQIAAAGARTHPRNADLRVLSARALLRRGRLAAAKKAANAALQIEPEQVAGWLVLARIQLDLGEPRRAEESVQRGLKVDGQRVDALRFLASLRAARGAPDLAVITLRRALAIQPDNPSLLNALATQRHRLGQTKAGIVALRRAVKLAPKKLVLQRNLAELLLDDGQVDEAVRHARRAAKQARLLSTITPRIRQAIEATLARTVCAAVLLKQLCKGVRKASDIAVALRDAFAKAGISVDQKQRDRIAADVAIHIKKPARRCRQQGGQL